MLIRMAWRVLVNAASHGDWGSGRRENRREKTKSKGTGDEGERVGFAPERSRHHASRLRMGFVCDGEVAGSCLFFWNLAAGSVCTHPKITDERIKITELLR